MFRGGGRQQVFQLHLLHLACAGIVAAPEHEGHLGVGRVMAKVVDLPVELPFMSRFRAKLMSFSGLSITCEVSGMAVLLVSAACHGVVGAHRGGAPPQIDSVRRSAVSGSMRMRE